ncbi:MAG TPA: 1,2-phenylacetyl-CoA epoxidase subunit PaaC [Chitinophagaceae bacterium]|nr:1,2-phenylacetyl-CoA epoxidase subunit PaaC [Chitinophagaceae bacterium]
MMDESLINYTLHLADNSLIMGHRLSEWTGHGPILEQDIAISNIALDLIGQSRNFYQYTAQLKGGGTTEDDLAYLRDPGEFKNILLSELPNGDWARTILKLFFFSTYQYYLYQKLIGSSDTQLSAIAEKSLKEVTYHLRWSSEWVIRLGDGTEESHTRIEKALQELWDYTGEMFIPAEYETESAKNNIGVDINSLEEDWKDKVKSVLEEATISFPVKGDENKNGKEGKHTEHLQSILNDMQYLQRTYPGCEW